MSRKIYFLLPLFSLLPALTISCAQTSQFDITIDKDNYNHLSATNLSVTLIASVFDRKNQLDVSDDKVVTWTCSHTLPNYITEITNDNIITLVLSTDTALSYLELVFTASCEKSSKSTEVIVDHYTPPPYSNKINLDKSKILLTQSNKIFQINATISGQDPSGIVAFNSSDLSKLPSWVVSSISGNQLELSLKNGSDTERGNFTIRVSFNDAATQTIVVETESYESWPIECIPKEDLDITGSTFNRIKQGVTPAQLDTFTTLKIPKQVTKIANWALGYDATGGGSFRSYLSSNNTILDWGESKITSIGYYSFIMTPFAGELVLPSTLTTLTEGCFTSCDKFTSLDMSYANKLTVIPKTAFMGCTALQSIKFNNSIQTIGTSAFADCESLVGDIKFPTNLTSIQPSAFSMAGVNGSGINLIWNTIISTLGENAFLSAKISGDLIIPNAVKTIGQSCFINAGIDKVVIPASCTKIEQWAFHSCPNLKEFDILSTTYFPYCPKGGSTSRLTLLNETPIDPNGSDNSVAGAVIVVPNSMYNIYKNSTDAKQPAWPSRLNIRSA